MDDETTETRVALATPKGEVGGLIRAAIDHGVPAESMEKLVNLYERLEDRKARAAFNVAFAKFKAGCPPIIKTATAKIVGRSGSTFTYTYTPLDVLCRTVDPPLQKRGFAYSWDSSIDGGNLMNVVCSLVHRAGYSQSSRFSCPVESKAGMSEQQKYASALSYAKRQTLTSVLGIATTDDDSDAAQRETIGPNLIADIETMLSDLEATVPNCRKRFLKFCGVNAVEEIDVGAAESACAALVQMQKKAGPE